MQVLVDSAPGLGRKGGLGRSYADAPEIDGTVFVSGQSLLRFLGWGFRKPDIGDSRTDGPFALSSRCLTR